MFVADVGAGEPESAVVVCVHGDETCGLFAVEDLLSTVGEPVRPFRVVVANVPALVAGERFVDVDLNRSFPGDAQSDVQERRLASALVESLAGLPVLDVHATVSYAEPFALLSRFDTETRAHVRSTGVSRVVDVSEVGGGLVDAVGGVAVEAGLKHTGSATRNAGELMRRFLASTGTLDAEQARSDPTVYRIEGPVPVDPATPASERRVLAENFERVAPGERYAVVGSESQTAAEPFHPVLLSADYEDVLGYRAREVGPLSAYAPPE